jgi:hypothetical protein
VSSSNNGADLDKTCWCVLCVIRPDGQSAILKRMVCCHFRRRFDDWLLLAPLRPQAHSKGNVDRGISTRRGFGLPRQQLLPFWQTGRSRDLSRLMPRPAFAGSGCPQCRLDLVAPICLAGVRRCSHGPGLSAFWPSFAGCRRHDPPTNWIRSVRCGCLW